MNYVTHNQNKEIDTCYTSLIACIDVDYATLKRIFGKPTFGDGYKVDAEWEIEFEDGKVATIYNYKSGKNYNGSNGTPKTKIRDWHIGGREEVVADRIKEIIKKHSGFVKKN